MQVVMAIQKERERPIRVTKRVDENGQTRGEQGVGGTSIYYLFISFITFYYDHNDHDHDDHDV